MLSYNFALLHHPIRPPFLRLQSNGGEHLIRSMRFAKFAVITALPISHSRLYTQYGKTSSTALSMDGFRDLLQRPTRRTAEAYAPMRVLSREVGKAGVSIGADWPYGRLSRYLEFPSHMKRGGGSLWWPPNVFLRSGGVSPGGGGGDGGPSDPDVSSPHPPKDVETLEERLIPRTCLFVLGMFVLAGVLWWLAQPGGRHVGWNYLHEHAGEIRSVDFYRCYTQVRMTDGRRVYVGLLNEADTQRHVDELRVSYAKAKAKERASAEEAGKNKVATTKGKDREKAKGAASEAGEAPFEGFPCVMRDAPLAERALSVVGVVAWVVPYVFFPIFVIILSRHIGKSISYAVEVGKGKTKPKDMTFKVETTSSTRFRDIAGMKEAKKEITEIVDFLRNPQRYTKLGAKIPTGALLLGPPGTGKTLLAKAVAGESGVAFIPVCGSDFVELYVGMGALRVRQLFKEAKKQRCIVYIDEIDAVGLKRRGAGNGEKQEQEQTLNELLTQLDGFNTGSRGDVMVLASSNVAQEALDPALIRPGRFDRIIHVDSPVISERIDIFKVHLSKLKLVPDDGAKTATGVGENPTTTSEALNQEDRGNSDPNAVESSQECQKAAMPSVRGDEVDTNSKETQLVISTAGNEKVGEGESISDEYASEFSFDFHSILRDKSEKERALIDTYAHRMSNLCPGFVGSDIANVCNEAAILASREGSTHVELSYLERSIDRVLAGIEHRSRVLSPFEKKVVAHHEAGHAVAGWFLNRADPLMKVSIVPRGGSALGYAQYLPNENSIRTAKEIRDSLCVTLGGRVAEEIFFNHLSTGASDDLRKVARLAYMYVAAFSPGPVYPSPGTESTRITKPFGSKKSDEYDRQAKQLVAEVYQETYNLLSKHKADMEKLAQHLLTKELLTHQDVLNYLGERPARSSDKIKGV
ncbi:unnamed protein product [Phytomonas sp. EM1]|nr:unnamed protein product [Phytomonas sp. EM1]|eukprot:CCW65198.1 unnamed protein product [Phytomonas sp. isolate EM1]